MLFWEDPLNLNLTIFHMIEPPLYSASNKYDALIESLDKFNNAPTQASFVLYNFANFEIQTKESTAFTLFRAIYKTVVNNEMGR